MGKGKLVAGIILIIIGVGLIPASFGMNNLLERRMDESIATSFYSIRTSVLPYTYDLAYADATPVGLFALKAAAEPQIPKVVNGSVTYYTIKGIIDDLATDIGEVNATNWFFNDPSWNATTGNNYSIIGISEYSGLGNLSFTPEAIATTYSKFKQTGYLGLGVNEYLTDYEDAIGNIPLQDAMAAAYNSTWDQITNVSAYIIDYLFPQVPTLGGFPFEATAASAEDFFYIQWVNSSVVPGTWKLEVDGDNYNVWEYKKYDLELSEIQALWDPTDISAPLNDTGIKTWYMSSLNATLAAELTALFGLTTDEYEHLMSYFFEGKLGEDIVGPIFQDLGIITIRDLAYDKFYLQWANGEIFTEGLTFINPNYEGFEVSFPPESTGISPTVARILWAGNTLHGFANLTGIHEWFGLARDTEPDMVTYNLLMNTFGFSTDQMDALLEWIVGFQPNSVIILTEDQDLYYPPHVMAEFLTTGTYIAAGLISFIGLIFLLNSFKKGR